MSYGNVLQAIGNLFKRKPQNQVPVNPEAAGAAAAAGFDTMQAAAGAAMPFAPLYSPAIASGAEAGLASQSTTPWLASFTTSFSNALDQFQVPTALPPGTASTQPVPSPAQIPRENAVVVAAQQRRTLLYVALGGTLLFVALAGAAALVVGRGRRRRR